MLNDDGVEQRCEAHLVWTEEPACRAGAEIELDEIAPNALQRFWGLYLCSAHGKRRVEEREKGRAKTSGQ